MLEEEEAGGKRAGGGQEGGARAECHLAIPWLVLSDGAGFGSFSVCTRLLIRLKRRAALAL